MHYLYFEASGYWCLFNSLWCVYWTKTNQIWTEDWSEAVRREVWNIRIPSHLCFSNTRTHISYDKASNTNWTMGCCLLDSWTSRNMNTNILYRAQCYKLNHGESPLAWKGKRKGKEGKGRERKGRWDKVTGSSPSLLRTAWDEQTFCIGRWIPLCRGTATTPQRLSSAHNRRGSCRKGTTMIKHL